MFLFLPDYQVPQNNDHIFFAYYSILRTWDSSLLIEGPVNLFIWINGRKILYASQHPDIGTNQTNREKSK